MDERFVADLIEDLDHMRQLLERCVRRLRTQVSGDISAPMASPVEPVLRMSESQNDIRAEIDRQRQAIVAQVEQVKAQALSAVASARSGISTPGVGGGMPGFGVSGSGLAGMLGSLDPEKLKELQQKIAEAAENKK